MGVSINRICENCGRDDWVTIDNKNEFIIYCYHSGMLCNEIIYYKNDFLKSFTCSACGSRNGIIAEDDITIDVICNNCRNKQTVFNKPPILTNNRNGGGIVLDKEPPSSKIILKTESPVQCPRCGSTQITAGARGVNGVWGFIGASKTVNRCMKCGHSWKPHK